MFEAGFWLGIYGCAGSAQLVLVSILIFVFAAETLNVTDFKISQFALAVLVVIIGQCIVVTEKLACDGDLDGAGGQEEGTQNQVSNAKTTGISQIGEG